MTSRLYTLVGFRILRGPVSISSSIKTSTCPYHFHSPNTTAIASPCRQQYNRYPYRNDGHKHHLHPVPKLYVKFEKPCILYLILRDNDDRQVYAKDNCPQKARNHLEERVKMKTACEARKKDVMNMIRVSPAATGCSTRITCRETSTVFKIPSDRPM